MQGRGGGGGLLSGGVVGWRCSAEVAVAQAAPGGPPGPDGWFLGQPRPTAQRVLPLGQAPKTRLPIPVFGVFGGEVIFETCFAIAEGGRCLTGSWASRHSGPASSHGELRDIECLA